MSRKKIRLTILSEDRLAASFAIRYLSKRGFNPKKITPKIAPRGKGSGKNYVTEQLPNELMALQTHTDKNTALLVLTDADDQSVSERESDLINEISAQGLSPIQPKNRIAILIPKWCIESWLLYAVGEEIHENEKGKAKKAWGKYQRQHKVSLNQVATIYHEEICVGDLPDDAPQSLQHACDELAKIL